MASEAQLIIKIAGQLDGSVASSVKQAQSLLEGLNKKGLVKGIGSAVGAGMLAGTKALLGGSVASIAAMAAGAGKVIKDSITSGMSLENAMTDLAGTAGIEKGSQVFNDYMAAAQEVGRTTNKTSTDAAEALKYMALAGWDPYRSMESLEGMVKLSSATGLDLARTSDLVTDSMGALGLKTEDYARYLDLVATADAAANYSGEEYMETMIRSGGAARNLGMSLEELSAMAGVLADNGTKGSAAGTAINRMLRNMRTDTATKAFDALGTSLYDAQGQFKGLDTVLGELNTVLADKTPEQTNQYLDAIFGAFSSQAKYLLEAQKAGRLSDLMDEYSADAVAGNLESRYSTMVDNLKGDIDLLKSAYASLGEGIYQSMGDVGGGLRGIIQDMTGYVNQIHDAFDVDGLSGIATELGNIFGDVAGKISEAAPAAIDAAFNFGENLMQSLRIDENMSSIGDAAASIVTSIGTNFATYTGEFGQTALSFISNFTSALSEQDAGTQIAEAIGQAVTGIGDWFGENGGSLGDAAGQLISQLATGLASHADEIIPAGIQIIGGLVQGLIQGAGHLVGAMPAIIGGLLSSIPSTLGAVMEAGQGIGESLVEGIKSVISGFGETFHEMLDTLFDVDYGDAEAGVEDMFISQTTAMIDAIQSTWNNGSFMSDMFGVDYNAYQPVGENPLADQVNAWVQAGTAIQEVAAQVEQSGNAFISADYTMQDAANVYTELANASLETAQANVEAANAANLEAASLEMIGEASESTTAGLDSVNAAIDSLGDASLEGIGDEIMAEAEAMTESVESSVDTLYSAVESMGDIGTDTFTNLIQSEDAQARAGEIVAAMETVSTGVTAAIDGMQSGVAGSMSALADSLSSASDGFTSLVDTATSAAESIKAAMEAASAVSISQPSEVPASPETGEASASISMQIDTQAVQAAAEEVQAAVDTIKASLETIKAPAAVSLDTAEAVQAATEVQTALDGIGEAIAGLESGSVYLDISQVSDAAGQIQTAVDGITQSMGSISGGSVGAIDISGITSAASEIQAAIDQINESLAGISSAPAVMINQYPALESANQIKTAIDNIQSAIDSLQGSVSIEINTSEAASAAEEVQSSLDAINSALSSIGSGSVGIDVSSLTASAEAAQEAIEGINNTLSSIEGGSVSIDVSEAVAAVESIQASLGSLEGATVEIDASAATAAAAEVQTAQVTMDMSFAAIGVSAAQVSADMAAMAASAGASMMMLIAYAISTQAAVSAAFFAMTAVIVSQMAVALASAQSTAQGIYAAFASINLAGVASNMMAGLTSGIIAGGAAAVAAAQSIAAQISAAMSSALQIHSPSRVMFGIGEYTGEGLALGMESTAPMVYDASQVLAKNAELAVNDRESISAPVRTIAESQPAANQITNQTVTQSAPMSFSPTININISGNATEEQANNIAGITVDRLRQMLRQIQFEDRRAAFA